MRSQLLKAASAQKRCRHRAAGRGERGSVSTVSPLSVRDFLEEQRLSFLNLDVVAGGEGLDNRFITNPRIQKPGLALAGFLPYVKPGRIQILGESEFSYLATLETNEAARRVIAIVDAGVPGSPRRQEPPARQKRCCAAATTSAFRFLSTSQRTSDTIEGGVRFPRRRARAADPASRSFG